MDELTTTVTITRTVTADRDSVFVDATYTDGAGITTVEALGMLELAKAILLEQAT